MTSLTSSKSIEYVNYRLGFKVDIPEHLYKAQTEFLKGVAFGQNPVIFIGSFPEYSIEDLYSYAIQQQRNQAPSIGKDEYVYLRGLPTRNCIFETRSMYSHMHYIQRKRGVYMIACFIGKDQLTDDGFGVIVMAYNMVQLPPILNSFEELPYSDTSTTNFDEGLVSYGGYDMPYVIQGIIDSFEKPLNHSLWL
jgi:hypothetical protein